MKASLKNYRQAPRKTRLVGDLLKGKNVIAAEEQLQFVPKRATLPILKLLQSAIKNAEMAGISKEDLFVKSVRIDQGVTLKRIMPRARGTASRINKRTSHVVIELGTKEDKAVKTSKKEKKVDAPAKEVKAKAAKKVTTKKAKA